MSQVQRGLPASAAGREAAWGPCRRQSPERSFSSALRCSSWTHAQSPWTELWEPNFPVRAAHGAVHPAAAGKLPIESRRGEAEGGGVGGQVPRQKDEKQRVAWVEGARGRVPIRKDRTEVRAPWRVGSKEAVAESWEVRSSRAQRRRARAEGERALGRGDPQAFPSLECSRSSETELCGATFGSSSLRAVRHWDRGWRWTPRPQGKGTKGLRLLTLLDSYPGPFSAVSSTSATPVHRSGLHWDPAIPQCDLVVARQLAKMLFLLSTVPLQAVLACLSPSPLFPVSDTWSSESSLYIK